jgi:hypothetical protein
MMVSGSPGLAARVGRDEGVRVVRVDPWSGRVSRDLRMEVTLLASPGHPRRWARPSRWVQPSPSAPMIHLAISLNLGEVSSETLCWPCRRRVHGLLGELSSEAPLVPDHGGIDFLSQGAASSSEAHFSLVQP